MLRTMALVALAGVLTFSACSSSPDDAPATTGAAEGPSAAPLITPGGAPAGGSEATVGAVRLTLPASMQLVEPLQEGEDKTVGRYRSTEQDASGVAAAVIVTVAATASRSPQAEGEAVVGYQTDVAKAKNLAHGPVQWQGFDSAYAVEYDDAQPVNGSTTPLHALVVVAKTPAGQLVNVTAKAPPELFDSLGLKDALGSLRPTDTGS